VKSTSGSNSKGEMAGECTFDYNVKRQIKFKMENAACAFVIDLYMRQSKYCCFFWLPEQIFKFGQKVNKNNLNRVQILPLLEGTFCTTGICESVWLAQ
jgi:hypothetical protein